MWATTGIPRFLFEPLTILAQGSSTLSNGFKGHFLQCPEKKNCEDDLLPLFGLEYDLIIFISDKWSQERELIYTDANSVVWYPKFCKYMLWLLAMIVKFQAFQTLVHP